MATASPRTTRPTSVRLPGPWLAQLALPQASRDRLAPSCARTRSWATWARSCRSRGPQQRRLSGSPRAGQARRTAAPGTTRRRPPR
eukprot:7888289-Alexandrium_andersonii.AAC.1